MVSTSVPGIKGSVKKVRFTEQLQFVEKSGKIDYIIQVQHFWTNLYVHLYE